MKSGSGTPRVCAAPKASTCAAGKAVLGVAKSSPYMDNGDLAGMAAGDFNGDGKADLVLTHVGVNGGTFIEVLLNKGDGSFMAGVKIEANVSSYGVVAADFTGDCNADILASSFGTGSVDDFVELHTGKGDGTFGLGMPTELSNNNITKLIAADLNGDKNVDFLYYSDLAVSGLGPNLVLNVGGGMFAGPGTAIPGTSALDGIGDVFNIGDVGGDPSPDLVWATQNDGMCVRINSGNAQFGASMCNPLSTNLAPSFIEVADINGDGKADVVVGGDDSSGNNDRTFNVFIRTGDGTFADHVPYGFNASLDAMKVADVDGDGKPDLVAFGDSGTATLYVMKNKGDGTFDAGSPQLYSVTGPLQRTPELLVTGDFNGNGLVGFAALDRYKNNVVVYAGECKP